MKNTALAAAGVPTARRHTILAVAAAAALALPATALAHEPRGVMRTPAPAAVEMDRAAARPAALDRVAADAAMPLVEQHSRRGGSSSGGSGGQAVPRGGSGTSSGGGSGGATRGGGSSGGRTASDPGGSTGTADRGGARTRGGDSSASGGDTPTYSRPRNGRPSTGTAVARRPGDGRTIIVDRGGYYGGLYPWGWGGLGLGGYYGYYDPWGWYDPYPPAVYGYGGYDGALKIKVKPRDAEVYVDGYFAGEVDDYDGVFQKLQLEPGPHRIEIRLEGYEPLTFEVRIQPDRTVTYKGEMRKTDTAD